MLILKEEILLMVADNINTHNELSYFQLRYEKLLTMPHSNFKNHVQQHKRKNETTNQLLKTIQNIASIQDSPNTYYINRNTIQKNDAGPPNLKLSSKKIIQNTATNTKEFITRNY